MTSTSERPRWTAADFGAAMVAHYTSTWPKGWRRRADGVEGPAHHRGGDNPTSFRIVEPRGVAMDARRGRSYSAREYAEEIAGCSLPEMMERWGASSTSSRMTSAAERGARETSAFPPPAELHALWDACRPVDSDPAARAWIAARGLNLSRVLDAGVARALPASGAMPAWATCAGAPWARDYRLLLPLFDDRGALCSLHARRTSAVESLPKSASPRGFTTSGLVMADELGRSVLRGALAREVVVVEGAPNALAWMTSASDADEDAPAVIGIISGSWTRAHAARLPAGAHIVIDTDADAAGEAYAARIVETLSDRPDVRASRIRWHQA